MYLVIKTLLFVIILSFTMVLILNDGGGLVPKREYLVIKTLLFVISWMGSADHFSG